MAISTLQNNHYLAFVEFYRADSLVSLKKCGTFAAAFNFCVFLGS